MERVFMFLIICALISICFSETDEEKNNKSDVTKAIVPDSEVETNNSYEFGKLQGSPEESLMIIGRPQRKNVTQDVYKKVVDKVTAYLAKPELLSYEPAVEDTMLKLKSKVFIFDPVQMIQDVVYTTEQVAKGVEKAVNNAIGWIKRIRLSLPLCVNKSDDECLPDKNKEILCRAELLQQPLLDKEEVLNTSCEVADKVKADVLPGPLEPQNPQDPEYKRLAEVAVRKYENIINAHYLHTITEVHYVTKQLVPGTIYIINFSLASTKCLRVENQALDKCEVKASASKSFCSAKITMKPSSSENYEDVLLQCPVCFSGNISIPEERNSTEEKYRKTADEAVRIYEKDNNAKFIHKVIRIENVTELVKSNLLTDIYFYIAPTECLVGQDDKQCALKKSPQIQCHAIIEDQPFSAVNNDIKISCENDNLITVDDKSTLSRLDEAPCALSGRKKRNVKR